jgi:hypothetical protein
LHYEKEPAKEDEEILLAINIRVRPAMFFGVLLAALVALALSAPIASAQTCQPELGKQGAAPFTVWYCRGDATGSKASTTVAQLLDRVWSQMTQPEPNGLGPPIAPETNGGRISVYVSAPNQEVVLGPCPEACKSVGTNYGFALPTAPFIESAPGVERSSAALVINEQTGLNDATVIHEFFHVLQYAHNINEGASWLGEASATWAENQYGATDTSRVRYFRENFQNSPGSALNRKSAEHEYGAYVWLVWLAQSAGSPSAVFRMFSALEPAASSQPAVIDPLLRDYLATLNLPWAPSFRAFAVEHLNRNLSPSVTPLLFNRGPLGDPAVPLGVTPRFVRAPFILNLGARRTAVKLLHLSALFEYVRAISPAVRAVTITSAGMRPWGDVTVLARTRAGWRRTDLSNGSVKFCRRIRSQSVDQLYVIADNHDDLGSHSGGSYTITGRRTC